MNKIVKALGSALLALIATMAVVVGGISLGSAWHEALLKSNPNRQTTYELDLLTGEMRPVDELFTFQVGTVAALAALCLIAFYLAYSKAK